MSDKIKNSSLISFIIIFGCLLNSGLLTTDALTHFNTGQLLYQNIFNGDNEKIKFITPLWAIINLILITFVNTFFYFLDSSITIFISKYFISFSHSVYMILAFIVCYNIITNNIKSRADSLILLFSIFFGTGLIYFFSAPYIENLVILLFSLRIIIKNKIAILITEISICLIKPYYYVFLLYFIFISKNKAFDNLFKQTAYFIFVFILIISQNYFLNAFSHNPSSAYNFDLYVVLNNFLDIFYSNSSGIFNTIPFLIILILFGSSAHTAIKFFLVLIFFSFLSVFNFWYAHLPMSGRYVLSIIPIFLPEIIKGFKSIKIYKNNLISKLFLILLVFNNILNLPTLNIKNTSYKHYAISSVSSGKFDKVKFYRHFHPINDKEFHQYYFNIKYIKSILINKKSFSFVDQKINTEEVYPSIGILRIKYAFKNLKKIKKNKQLKSALPLNVFDNYYSDMLVLLINIFVFMIIFCFLAFHIFFLIKIFKL